MFETEHDIFGEVSSSDEDEASVNVVDVGGDETNSLPRFDTKDSLASNADLALSESAANFDADIR